MLRPRSQLGASTWPNTGRALSKGLGIADLYLGKRADDEMNRSLTKMNICFLGGG